jgi:FkbH-like protein
VNFSDLRKNLKKDFTGLSPVRLAVVADWSVQMLSQALRGYGYEKGYDVIVYEAAYDQMEAELLDGGSDLYSFQPNFILIFPSAEKLQHSFYCGNERAGKVFAEKELSRLRALWDAAKQNTSAQLLCCNYCEIDDGIFGNYAGIFNEAFLFSVRHLNVILAEEAAARRDVRMIDIASLQNLYGRKNIFDERLYYLSKTVFAIDFLPTVAERILAVIETLKGRMKKCLITDLDNTIWGGIVGEDGMEGIQIGELGVGKAFSDLQQWMKELSKRGIALAVCSKNDEDKAKEPFEKHPDMVLRIEDISVFVANWEDKAGNIREICRILNIGTDSAVFLDDSPFERELVRQMLPEVTAPELPKDPVLYLTALQRLNLFETVGISAEDRERSLLYRQEAQREELRQRGVSFEEYLENLDMAAELKPFDSFAIPRVAQLTQRSNQFNLRTKRYSDQDIEKIANDKEKYTTFSVSLKDKFGEYGLIGVVILEKTAGGAWFLDTLLMSCRVLKRGVEEFIFNEIVNMAQNSGIDHIIGEYLPTPKNKMVEDLLNRFGFTKTNDGQWQLTAAEYSPKQTFVRRGSL